LWEGLLSAKALLPEADEEALSRLLIERAEAQTAAEHSVIAIEDYPGPEQK
jgi:hypothetical protein